MSGLSQFSADASQALLIEQQQQLLLHQLHQLQQQQQLSVGHIDPLVYPQLLLQQQQQQQFHQLLQLQQQMQQLQCGSGQIGPPVSMNCTRPGTLGSVEELPFPLMDRMSSFSGTPIGRNPAVFRPLSRAVSSPMVANLGSQAAAMSSVNAAKSAASNPAESNHAQSQQPSSSVIELNSPLWTGCSSPGPSASSSTALITELAMLKHGCGCGDRALHLERPARLQALLGRLQDSGLASKCVRLRARKATFEELESVHGALYCQLFGCGPLARQKLDASQLADLPIKSFVRLGCGGVGVDSDTTWNEMFTPAAARLAAGCVIELASKVAKGTFFINIFLMIGFNCFVFRK